MAGAFISVQGDIHSLAYNPAGLATLDSKQGTASYLNHLLDFQSGFLAYAQPFAQGTAAIGLHFFDYGQLDASNLGSGEFGANSVALSAGYSPAVLRNLSVGGSAKFIRFQIDDLTETALALDIGLILSIPDHAVNIGMGIFNFGTTTSAFIDTKDDLPLNFQIGASKTLEHLPVMVNVSLVKFKDESIDFRLGGEISLTEQLFVRLGYNSVGQDQKVKTEKDRLSGVSMGFGFKVNKYNIDYSLSSFGEVGTLNRVSLIGQF